MTLRLLKSASLAAPVFLAACATEVPEQYTSRTAAFGKVSSESSKAISKQTVWVQSQAQAENVTRRVHDLSHKRTISADTAVQIALLNNRGLQAAYAEVGISAADVWQESLPENPGASIEILGIGASGLGLLRSIEARFATNLLDAKSRKARVALADQKYRRAQLDAVGETLELAAETREAWIEAVAAFERLETLKEASAVSEASSELANRLGLAGSLGHGEQAREHAFNAEMAAKTAEARLEAAGAKEHLTRLMGLWGTEIDYFVPDALPAVPKSIPRRPNIEATALNNRFDLKVAKLGLAASAQSFGLTNASRYVTDLDLVLGVEHEREIEDGNVERETTPLAELEFTLPIFDTGEARLRKAELSYLRQANIVAQRAVNIRSQARSAEAAYHGRHQIARHYVDTILPLRAVVDEAALLGNNGMITSTFEFLEDTRETLEAHIDADEAKRDFWLAKANLTAAIYGGISDEESRELEDDDDDEDDD